MDGAIRGEIVQDREGNKSLNRHRWGLLSFRGTGNLGDEIQSLAARRFLPRVDYFLERDNLAAFRGINPDETVRVVLNGWFCHHAWRFRLFEGIDPLLISMHITPGARKRFSLPDVVRSLEVHGPVGARDDDTLTFLRSLNVDAYLSSCLTLTLERPSVPATDDIVLNDVPVSVVGKVRARTAQHLVLTAHSDDIQVQFENRFAQAEALLRRYASAHSVITTRLHCALPCIAMNTPVLLLRGPMGKERFSGLLDFVHHCSVDEFLSGKMGWDPVTPPCNPGKHLGARAELIKRVSEFVEGV